MNANDKRRLRDAVIRTENTPQGLILPPSARRNIHAPVQEWAYNTTGYELKAGYIVAVTEYDIEKNKYTIARPTADNMPNIAVVKSSIVANGSGNRVELQFSGAVTLWYTGDVPDVEDTVGSTKNSFNAKIGAGGFAPLETGSDGRIRCRFFNAGVKLHPLYMNYGAVYYSSQQTDTTYTTEWETIPEAYRTTFEQGRTYTRSYRESPPAFRAVISLYADEGDSCGYAGCFAEYADEDENILFSVGVNRGSGVPYLISETSLNQYLPIPFYYVRPANSTGSITPVKTRTIFSNIYGKGSLFIDGNALNNALVSYPTPKSD